MRRIAPRSVYYLSFVIGLFCLSQVYAQSQDTIAQASSPLSPEPKHSVACRESIKALQLYHWKKPELNDSLSSQVFDAYLKRIDPNKIYFTKQDVDEFQVFRYALDNDLSTGDLSKVFIIYNKFRIRINERIDLALKLTPKNYDYTTDEIYEYDRSESPWLIEPEIQKLWEKKIKYELLEVRLDSSGSVKTVENRYKNLRKNLYKQKADNVFEFFMNSFTETIEPHTNYFSPRSADDFNISMSQSLEGIGCTLRQDNDYIQITDIVKGGPASRSRQIQINDKILAVAQGDDGEFVDVVGWTTSEAVILIRGPKGTIVRLKMFSAANNKSYQVRLVRDKIILEEQSAKSSILETKQNNTKHKIGVITLPTFYMDWEGMQKGEKNYKSTTRDVRRLIEDLKKEKIEGLVIDLRNNGGGSLVEAIDLSGLFIKEGPVVQVKEASGLLQVHRDNDPEITWNGPLVVLINRFSASASEIFAACLQDYNRGIIVGENSFGKGTVQNMLDLNKLLPFESDKLGQLKITFAKFYRVTGSSTQHKGVIPDISFPTIFSAEEFGESSYPTALPWDQIQPTLFSVLPDITELRQHLLDIHLKRVLNEREYKYLTEDVNAIKKKREQKYVSLNEAQLRKEHQQEDEKNWLRTNERRAAAGLKLLKAGEQPGKDDKAPDFILQESGNILVDMATMMHENPKAMRP
ncbi:MAG: carboxy terminal-processing peptidase [Bacteroidia bacterium]|nr:carboxy terminal-processing peptidase [Bacteroidia bacterium]